MALSLFAPTEEAFRKQLAEELQQQVEGESKTEEVREPGFRPDDDEDDSDEEGEGEDARGTNASASGAGDQAESGVGRRRRGIAATTVFSAFSRLSRDQVEALRYRGEDVARGLTKAVVREARAKELKNELLNRWVAWVGSKGE